MAQTVSDVIKNLKAVLADLEAMDPNTTVGTFAVDEGGFTDPADITNFNLEVTEDGGNLDLSIMVVPSNE